MGDRHVVEAMRREGCVLGGEQSGHLIFMNYSTTGDGILAAMQLIRIMIEQGRPLSELAGLLTPFPQKLVNVHVERKVPFEGVDLIQRSLRAAEEELGTRGRVLLRYSGTESVARVMVEGEDEGVVDRLAEQLAADVKEGLRAG